MRGSCGIEVGSRVDALTGLNSVALATQGFALGYYRSHLWCDRLSSSLVQSDISDAICKGRGGPVAHERCDPKYPRAKPRVWSLEGLSAPRLWRQRRDLKYPG